MNMKTTMKNFALGLLIAAAFSGKSQLCDGSTASLTAMNPQNLTNQTYSLFPGGLTSSNPVFIVTPPLGNTMYTLYCTGTNSNSQIVTTSTSSLVTVNGVSFNVHSQMGFILGCGTNSVRVVILDSAKTQPVVGGAVSYTFIAPGGSTVLSGGNLSSNNIASITIPGTWTVACRDNANQCTSWDLFNISTNTIAPFIGQISSSQDPLNCNHNTTLLQVQPDTNSTYVWQPFGSPGDSLAVNSNSSSMVPSVAVVVTLVATKSTNGCKSTATFAVVQDLYKPNAIISGTSSQFPICSPTVVLFNASTTSKPPGFVPVSGVISAQVWQGPSPQTSLGISSTYTAYTEGIYSMMVSDSSNGCSKTTTMFVSVKPSPAFNHTVTNGVAVYSDASAGTNGNTAYFWDFGDGSFSTQQSPIHTYASGGAHWVKLRAANSYSTCRDSVIQSVNISGIPCVANSNFSLTPTGTAQIWNAIPAYPWNVSAATWSWGDGSSSNILYTSHQYSAAGMYSICLSVTVSCVASSSSCASYSVYRSTQAAQILQVNVVAPGLTRLAKIDATSDFSWEIIPNPNAGLFNLSLSGALNKDLKVVIRDLSGRTIHLQNVETDALFVPVQTSGLPSGLYLISLEGQDMRVTKRMAIE
jgi:PKD repeat protein